ncbi:hypothetical protein D9615_008967 [Tricholomella constricta]|uniref:DUF6533 domain-containing protein n=1 Tax=Tricholomella constricta TaxID=117010 RepID=A0A8H5H0Q4_9AGAR|nr:hypothetical protein D9615_008967 [Tricholomella constricta]
MALATSTETQWDLQDAVRGNRVCNYSGVVAFTFTMHEWLSSAQEEAEQIWKRPRTGLKFLYVFLRVLSLGTQLFPVVLSLAPFSTSLLSHSARTCRVVVGFQGAASQVLMLGVQIVLLMRVDALYYKHVKLRLVLRALYVAEVVEMCVVFVFAMPKIEYGLNCLVTYFPPEFAAAFFLPPMGMDSILFALTMVKFYQAIREGWGREPVIYRFLQDGIWAFALPFCLFLLLLCLELREFMTRYAAIVTVNFMCMAFLPGPVSSIAYSWVIAIPAFAGCRLILNMSHLLKSRRSEGPSTYPEQDFMISGSENQRTDHRARLADIASSMTSTMSSSTQVYKGKVAHRSWQQLPEELVRHIATFYLWDISAKSYCPQTWDTRENWHHRMLYVALRDANDLEHHLMSICPQWHAAIQHHLFWQQAIALIDPGDVLAHHAVIHPKNAALNSSSAPAQPTKLSPYRHFRNITNCSCLVCRLNSPATTIGLTTAKRYLHTPYLRTIALCREHDRRPAAFCGLCLRAAPVFENNLIAAGPQAAAVAVAQQNLIGVMDNDDKDTFPAVEATCRTCRLEWLWKRAGEHPKDRDAIGGGKLLSDDWETRNVVDSFLDLSEGNVKDVLLLAREKLWLRTNTRLQDILLQALAASRFNAGRGGYEGEGPEDEQDEDEEDEEDDIEIMQNEEAGARELALGDWARARILDGHWLSPADAWYEHSVPGQPGHVRAVHPCPWTRDASSFGSSPPVPRGGDGEDDEEKEEEEDEDVHPRRATLRAEIPPTYGLCEQAFVAHQRQMKVVLIGALRNLVRKIIIECQTPGAGHRVEDPAIRAAKMTMEEVLRELREEEGVWFDGFDWVERRMNDSRERERETKARSGEDDSSASSTTSGSRSSNGTSPVLSTTTLQTTPSPPPTIENRNKKEREGEEAEASAAAPAPTPVPVPVSVPPVQVMISVAPVLDPPKLLRPIPYIPTTASHFPPYTIEALKSVWREACAPLYHCRCSICLRAAATAALANAGAGAGKGQGPPSVVPTQAQAQAQQTPVPLPVQPGEETVVRLEEVDGEDEIEVEVLEGGGYDAYEDEVDDDDEGEEDEEATEAEVGYEELESVSGASEGEEEDCEEGEEEEVVAVTTTAPSVLLIPRPRKRSCDELEARVDSEEDGEKEGKGRGGSPPLSAHSEDGSGRRSGTPPKRARTDTGESVRSGTGTGTGTGRGMATPEPEPGLGRRHKHHHHHHRNHLAAHAHHNHHHHHPEPHHPHSHPQAVEESESPRRMRKRSSEELEDLGDESCVNKKKMKVGSGKGKGNAVVSRTPESVAEGEDEDEGEGEGQVEGEESPPPTSEVSESRPSSESVMSLSLSLA